MTASDTAMRPVTRRRGAGGFAWFGFVVALLALSMSVPGPVAAATAPSRPCLRGTLIEPTQVEAPHWDTVRAATAADTGDAAPVAARFECGVVGTVRPTADRPGLAILIARFADAGAARSFAGRPAAARSGAPAGDPLVSRTTDKAGRRVDRVRYTRGRIRVDLLVVSPPASTAPVRADVDARMRRVAIDQFAAVLALEHHDVTGIRQLGLALLPFTLAAAGWALVVSLRHRRRRRIHLPLGGPDSRVVDVSDEARARIVSGRLNFGVQLVFVLAPLVIAATTGLPTLAAVPLVLVVVGLQGKIGRYPGLFLYTYLTGRTPAAFVPRADMYTYVSERGVGRRFSRTVPLFLLGYGGMGLMLVSGIPLAFEGTNLPTGIPSVTFHDTGLPAPARSAILLAAGLVLVLATNLLERRTRLRQLSGAEEVTEAHRTSEPAVLLLREFGAEHVRVRSHGAGSRETVPRSLLPRPRIYLEDALTWFAWAWGPVVSIADPRGVRDRTLGAARFGVDDADDWKLVVDDLIRRARLIVAICGTREGVRWELDRLVGSDARFKTVFVNPTPYSAETMNEALGTGFALDGPGALIGAIATPSGWRPICSSAAEDVDYEMAVQYLARRLDLMRDVVRDVLAGATQ